MSDVPFSQVIRVVLVSSISVSSHCLWIMEGLVMHLLSRAGMGRKTLRYIA